MFDKLTEWSLKHYSDLPWRMNRSLYNTLVSEIMLQQTTVATVINHFDNFIMKYPTIHDLAAISEDQILKDWKGLGYYRRARNLLNAAKQIEEKFHGAIPTNLEELKSIKGIGDYTANAIIALGADEPGLTVDANLERVLARLYDIRIEKGPKLQKEIYKLYQEGKIATEMHKLGPRNYNEALMDLGRSICKARSATCELCPLSSICQTIDKDPLTYPKVNGKKKEIESYELHLLRVIVRKDNQILCYKKSATEWLSNQFELPTFILSSEDETLKQYPNLDDENLFLLPSFKTAITKYKISNYVLYADQEDLKALGQGYEFKVLDDLNLSTASLKALALK